MITLTTEQAQQIEEIVEHLLVEHPTARHHKACVEALSIIRAARAQEQAEPEPVADVYFDCRGGCRVNFLVNLREAFPAGAKLYAAPVRTKDLTDDEILQMYTMTPQAAGHVGFARAVIAADREKNR